MPPPSSRTCKNPVLLIALACAAVCQAQSPVSWLTLGADLRGRAEFVHGVGFQSHADNYYYLSRLRLNAGIEPLPWLHFFFQGQDSRAPGYRQPVPDTVADTLDLRQGYVELGATEKGPWGFRLGRQELIFGEERLVGAASWGNVGRAFDGARLSWKKSGSRLDWFATSVVVPVNGHFDRPRTSTRLYGMYGSFENWIPKSAVEPFFFVKTDSRLHLHVYTGGARLDGKLPRRFDYSVETAVQSGPAWAGHGRLGYTLSKDPLAPRLIAEYNYASGQGRLAAFDQLYPANHSKYGTADVIGWRNIHDLMAASEWKPHRKWKLAIEYHSFRLATRNDALYTEAGAVLVRNPNASSSHVGEEMDLYALWRATPKLQFGLGAARLFPGRYLKESTPGGSYTYPYVLWNYTL